MPISTFQKEVLLLLKSHRNPNSYVAGGVAIHRAPTSFRMSNDIDFFHDTDEAVSVSADADLTLLQERGYSVDLIINQPSFVRAMISRGVKFLKLEWVRDTAFRFFPIEEDSELGWRLHDVDLSINKCLALANRNEVRDILDLIQLEKDVISLASACWAACGKDPGFTPEMLLDCMKKNSIIRPELLSAESLVKDLTAVELKKDWMSRLDTAEKTISKFPASDLGCVYVSRSGRVVHSPSVEELKDLRRHFGSLGGAWPRVVK